MTQAAKPTPSPETRPVDQTAVLHARMDQIMVAVTTLTDETISFRKDVCDHLHKIDSNVDDLMTWRKTASDRVRKESSSNLDQDAAIAKLIERTDTLDKKQDVQTGILTSIYDGGKKLRESKLFQLIVLVATFYIVDWLRRHGVEIPK